MCDCIQTVNKALATRGLTLDCRFCLSDVSPVAMVQVKTKRIGAVKARRSKEQPIIGAFCPFCGEKLVKQETPGEHAQNTPQ